MTNSEKKKIVLIIFHVIILLFLFVSITLLLDDIFTQSVSQDDYIDSFHISKPRIIAPFAILFGLISWLILLVKWIRNMRMEFYLKTIFLTKTFLILCLITLCFFN